MTNILNLSGMPDKPEERLLWLTGVKAAAQRELDDTYAATYAQLRLNRTLDWAIAQRIHGKKRILAMTRRWNRKQARMIRWNDGLDRTSSAFRVKDSQPVVSE